MKVGLLLCWAAGVLYYQVFHVKYTTNKDKLILVVVGARRKIKLMYGLRAYIRQKFLSLFVTLRFLPRDSVQIFQIL